MVVSAGIPVDRSEAGTTKFTFQRSGEFNVSVCLAFYPNRNCFVCSAALSTRALIELLVIIFSGSSSPVLTLRVALFRYRSLFCSLFVKNHNQLVWLSKRD